MGDELSERARAVIDQTVKEQLPILMDSLSWFRDEDDGPITTAEVAETFIQYALSAYEHGTPGFNRWLENYPITEPRRAE